MAEWIISSSVLTAGVIILRCILKGRISLRLQYALWALVLIRLLMPVSIGSSTMSIGNLTRRAAQTEETQLVSALTRLELPRKSYAAAYAEVAGEYEKQGIDISKMPLAEYERVDYEINSRMRGTWNLRDVLKLLWLAGISAVALCFFLSNLRFALRLKRSRRPLERDGCRLPVYISDAVETPCLFGFLRPAIYVTEEAAEDETKLRHVIEHETTHYLHGDHVWALLRSACLALHWFNPLVWRAAALSRSDAELACDEATIKRIGEEQRAEYGRTLIGMSCRKRSALLTTATTMTAGRGSLKERVALLAKKPKTTAYMLALVLILAAVGIGGTFTGAKNASAAVETLTDITRTLAGGGTKLHLALTLVSADGNKLMGDCAEGGNFNFRNMLTEYAFSTVSPKKLPTEGRKITAVPTGDEDWSLDFFEGSKYLSLNAGGETYCFSARPADAWAHDLNPIGDMARSWFDESQRVGLTQLALPDKSLDAAAAAKEYCESATALHIAVADGSMYRYSYVSCEVSENKEETERLRAEGRIAAATYVFSVETVFVPENSRARWNAAMWRPAEYSGDAPEGAMSYTRTCYMTLDADGWHGKLI